MPDKTVFDLPAYFDREYYQSRYKLHIEKQNLDQAYFWRNAYYDNAIAYSWCKVYNETLLEGWKEAFKAADAHIKIIENEYKSSRK